MRRTSRESDWEEVGQTPEQRRRYNLWTRYRVRPEDYDAILAHQGGVCAVCLRAPKVRRLSMDHDHQTGEMRGLLCWRCNRGLQHFYDKPDVMRRAVEYLMNPPPARHVLAPKRDKDPLYGYGKKVKARPKSTGPYKWTGEIVEEPI